MKQVFVKLPNMIYGKAMALIWLAALTVLISLSRPFI